MTIALPDPGELFISDIFGLAGTWWVYRCPNFFAKWCWIKRYFPDTPQSGRIPADGFVTFFRIPGLIGMWAYALESLIYAVLWITGIGVIGFEPPVIRFSR